jgi:large subunit ribosomal protein L24e
MAVCSYCNRSFDRTSGKVLIQNTGKILYFDSNKCEKYMIKLQRSPKRLKWTKPIKAVAK